MGPGGRLAVALGAAGAMLALAACDVMEEHRFEQSAVVPEAVRQVGLEGGAGSVSIDIGSGSTTSIEQTIQYRGDRPTVATHRLEAGTLVLDTDCGRHCSADYRVTVPEGVAVTGRVDSGDIDLTGMVSVDVETGSGIISVADVTGNVTAETGSGDINARGIGGNVQVHSGSGIITASDVAGTTTAEASSGDVNARGVSGNVDVETGSATIEVALMTPASIKATTGSGDVTLAVAQGHYRVVATTGSGDQHITVPNDPSAPNMLEAHTGSGQITIRPS
jgi:Putative adhesin